MGAKRLTVGRCFCYRAGRFLTINYKLQFVKTNDDVATGACLMFAKCSHLKLDANMAKTKVRCEGQFMNK